jgi:hypothetical protein
MRKLQLAILAASLAGAMSASASMTVSLDPATLNVAPGSTVNVSVDLSDSPGLTMTAMNAIILYDPNVFTYVDPSVALGNLTVSSGWDLLANATSGQLIVGAMDWTPPYGQVAAGAGTLFTFTLLANAGAPLGPSALTWGDASGGGGGAGFDYGDADFNDVVLPSSGASINVTLVPEPTTMMAGVLLLLPFGASTLRIFRKGQTA